MVVRSPSSCRTMSSADVAIEPTAMALTRIFGARSWAASRVQCDRPALAVP
jgi:hypothetical protein